MVAVTGKGEEVLHSIMGHPVDPTLEEAAVAVFARDVGQGRQPFLQHERYQGLGRHGGITTGEIGRTDYLDTFRFLGSVRDERFGIRHLVVSTKYQLCRIAEGT